MRVTLGKARHAVFVRSDKANPGKLSDRTNRSALTRGDIAAL